MTVKSVAFQGKVYVERPGVGMPAGAISVEALMGPDLVNLFNLVSSNLGRGRVKRFADNKKGAKRTWAILQEYDAEADPGLRAVHDSASGKANHFKVEGLAAAKKKAPLAAADKQQIASEAASRKPAPQSEQLLTAAAAAGAKSQAQAKARTSPPASADRAKDAEMPALRKAIKPVNLEPKSKVYARKAGSKQAILVDLLSRTEGATFGELYDALAQTGKPWRGVTIRSGLAWDINHIAGYGVTSELFNGEEFAKQGRTYEAERLGVQVGPRGGVTLSEGYDPELKLAVYRLSYPKGMEGPLPHIQRKA